MKMKLLTYLKENRNFFLIIAAVFIIAIIIGFLYQPDFIKDYIKDYVEKLLLSVEGKDFFQLLVFIFKNNLFASLFGVILGLAFAFYPLAIAIFNGYFIGYVLDKSIHTSGIITVFSLLPHGIFEIPALIISLGIGLKLGFSLIRDFFEKYKKNKYVYLLIPLTVFPFILFLVLLFSSLNNNKLRQQLNNNIINALKIFVYFIVPLLIIAAIIETAGIFLF